MFDYCNGPIAQPLIFNSLLYHSLYHRFATARRKSEKMSSPASEETPSIQIEMNSLRAQTNTDENGAPNGHGDRGQTTVPASSTSSTSPLDDDEDEIIFKDTDEKVETEDEKKKREMDELMKNAVPFGELFRYATGQEKVLMFFGALGAACAGAMLPAFSLVFGEMMNEINGNNFMTQIGQLALVFVYMGIGNLLCCYLELATFMNAAERQARQLRYEYVRALLRQEVAWHDQQKTGELTVKLTEETRKFQVRHIYSILYDECIQLYDKV